MACLVAVVAGKDDFGPKCIVHLKYKVTLCLMNSNPTSETLSDPKEMICRFLDRVSRISSHTLTIPHVLTHRNTITVFPKHAARRITLKDVMIRVSCRLALSRTLVVRRNTAKPTNMRRKFGGVCWNIVWPWVVPIVRIGAREVCGICSLDNPVRRGRIDAEFCLPSIR